MKLSRLLTAAVISSSAQAVWAGSAVEVVINPTPAHEGNIIVALCTPESFPHEERCPVRKVVPAKAAEQAIALSAPAPGRYAVIAVADVNGNSKLDTNVIGIPKEPVGVSRNPALRFGPPKFDETAVELNDNPQRITINLKRVEK
nr:DUF2141 domain-containing protein [uncultured bacterium]